MGLVLRHSSPRGGRSCSPVNPPGLFDADSCTRSDLALQTDFQPPRSPCLNRRGTSHVPAHSHSHTLSHSHARRHDVFVEPPSNNNNNQEVRNSRRCRSTRQPPRLVRQDAFRVEETFLRPQVAATTGDTSPMPPCIHMDHSTEAAPRLPQQRQQRQQQQQQQQQTLATVAWAVLPCRPFEYEYDGQDETYGRAWEEGELAFMSADKMN